MSYDNWEYISNTDYENPNIKLFDDIEIKENFIKIKKLIPHKKKIIDKNLIPDKKKIIDKNLIPDKKKIPDNIITNKNKGMYISNSYKNETITMFPSKSESIVNFLLNNPVPYDICDILYDIH